jgi:ABC-2 type transport system ATP-binding protein
MLDVIDVHKAFGSVRAVRGVSFSLAQGQVVGLLGPNGAGKTTTIRMITGSIPPDAGQVTVLGADSVDQSAKARRSIGYLPEAAPLYPEMSVEGYLRYRSRLFAMPRREATAAIDRVVARCWLGSVRARRTGQLSKGFRQRVGLAAALLHNPPVILLDEPTNGLDPTQIGETRRLVAELASDRTMLICSHILPEIEQVCNRVIVIAAGRVRADGTPRELAAATGAGVCVVELRAAAAVAERMLKSLPGVLSVTVSESAGWSACEVSGAVGAGDLREAIGAAALAGGMAVRELRARDATLERVFASILEAAAKEAA